MKVKYNKQEYELKFTTYMNNRLACFLMDEDEFIFGVITVNLPEDPITDEFCAYIDTNNLDSNIYKTLENLGEFTGISAVSGFCLYPEFRFHESLVSEPIR